MKVPANYTATLTFLSLLLCIDLAFILIHTIHVWTPWLGNRKYSIEADHGLAEVYQYIKLIWIVACLATAFLQTRIKVLISWTILFAFLLLDDATQIHEKTGFWLGERFALPAIAGLRPDDLGEILFAAFIGSLTIGVVAYALWRGEPRARQVSRDILCLLCVLAIFAVGVDTLHVIAHFKESALSPVLAMIEDGGEMFVISALTCYAFDIVSNAGQIRIDLWNSVKSTWKRANPVGQTV